MRWLTRSAVLGVAVGAQLHSAHASCLGGPGNGVPDANALALFVTSDITTGDINQFTGVYPNGDPAIPGGGGAKIGIEAADAICTYFATSPGPQNPLYSVRIPGHTSQPYFNQNNQAGTVQFMSLLSTSTADAIDRVTLSGLGGLNVVNGVRDYDIQGYCLASNIIDLFSGSDGTGYTISTSQITNENGVNPATGSRVWTGTGLFGVAGNTAAKAGGRYQPPGQPLDNTKGFCRGFDGVRTDDWQVVDGSGAAGTIQSASTDDKKNVWLNDVAGLGGLGTQSCSLGLRLYCLSGQPFDPAPLPPTTPAGGSGDPQFTGLQGQSFQVHGMPDEFFNLITTPAFQLNSRFTYLASGTCKYNNTECWTHPGTYVDQLGFMFPGIQIKTVAGPHHKGLRAWVNGEEVSAHTKFRLTTSVNQADNNTAIITVRHPHHDTIIVESPLFTVEVTNSDWFFNFNLMFHVPEILSAGRYMHYISDSRPNTGAVDKRYPAYPMHGLVGQTWKNARYPAKRYYQGEVDDYMMLDHALFSKQFLFNLYQY